MNKDIGKSRDVDEKILLEYEDLKESARLWSGLIWPTEGCSGDRSKSSPTSQKSEIS